MNLRQKKKHRKIMEKKNRKPLDILRHAEMSGPPIESMEHMLDSIVPLFVDWIKDIPDDQITKALEDLWSTDPNREK